jgi:molybdopterin-guanine dinucleotide biosynthesis protein A
VSDISAAILAGGKSTRFGIDKALLEFDNIPLLKRIYDQLTRITTQIEVIGEYREQAGIDGNCYKSDIIKNIGPIGGLYSALSSAQKPVLVVPCDMPFLLSEDLVRLLQKFDPNFEACIAVSSTGLEPLLGIYSPALHSKLKQTIEDNEYALFRFIKSISTKFIHYPNNTYNSRVFFNINTFSDYKKALYLKGQNYDK